VIGLLAEEVSEDDGHPEKGETVKPRKPPAEIRCSLAILVRINLVNPQVMHQVREFRCLGTR
jgi:hypothetical protein